MRVRLHTMTLAAAFCAGAPLRAEAPPDNPPAVVVLDVLVLPLVAEGVDAAVARSVDDVIAAHVKERIDLKATTLADINTLFEAERIKDLVGCDDIACTTDVAGAVGADRILAGRLARLGEEYLLTLRWLDAVHAESLAVVTRQVRGDESALPAAAQSGLRELLNETAATDETARAHKARPTFWTAELAAGGTFANYAEPYRPGIDATLRLGWGGRPTGTRFYLFLLGGAGFTYLGGRENTEVGEITYQRTQITPFVELRAAFPLDARQMTRVYAGVGFGVAFEWFAAEQTDGVKPEGRNMFPEARFVGGVWHRFNHNHSLYGGYRLRTLFGGDGLDSISELVEPKSTTSTVLAHAVELGWAFHF